jgi:uncharacterized 2Fe-2S/4Fe-4S cluster protein (DUF4445 family)
MSKLTLWPSGRVVEFANAVNLLDLLKQNDVYIKSTCGGIGSCIDCKVKVMSGEDNLSPQGFSELKQLGNIYHITKERMCCQTTISGSVAIDISSQVENMDSKKIKKTTKFKVKKKEDVEKTLREREENKVVKKEKDSDNTWFKHWDQEDKLEAAKKLGGNRRPNRDHSFKKES